MSTKEFVERVLDLGFDIEQNETAVKMLVLHGYQSLPVVAVDGFDNSWSGFRPDRIDELVEKRYHDTRKEVADN